MPPPASKTEIYVRKPLTIRAVECYYSGPSFTDCDAFDIPAAILFALEMNNEIFRLRSRFKACHKDAARNTRRIDITNIL